MRRRTELSSYIRAEAMSTAPTTVGSALAALAGNEAQLFYLFMVWSGMLKAVHKPVHSGPHPIELNLTDADIASVMRGFR